MKSITRGPLAVVFLVMFTATQLAASILPENDVRIGLHHKGPRSTITEKDFNNIIDKVAKVYAPIFKAHGATLKVERKWTNDRVNAVAYRRGNDWFIEMYGGLARHPATTPDGFALVVCHEIGHHLGGAPKKPGSIWGSGTRWASNEGQADYFATAKCFRKVYENDDNWAAVATSKIPQSVSKKCYATFPKKKEYFLCVRAALGGKSLATLLADISNNPEPSFESPSTRVVSSTDHNHPRAQCRLDTYYEGSACNVSHEDDFDDRDPEVAACTRAQQFEHGNRPLCWFKPRANSGGWL